MYGIEYANKTSNEPTGIQTADQVDITTFHSRTSKEETSYTEFMSTLGIAFIGVGISAFRGIVLKGRFVHFVDTATLEWMFRSILVVTLHTGKTEQRLARTVLDRLHGHERKNANQKGGQGIHAGEVFKGFLDAGFDGFVPHVARIHVPKDRRTGTGAGASVEKFGRIVRQKQETVLGQSEFQHDTRNGTADNGHKSGTGRRVFTVEASKQRHHDGGQDNIKSNNQQVPGRPGRMGGSVKGRNKGTD
mmetsp:Transcript_88749/g.237451  ORF Transcript_88749/g.237451 Transcript_88749/m.237451 type:complete len:247 (+) Transcript_88749:143-883(+)